MNLCLFDLDHTLLPLDSDYEFCNFLIQKKCFDAENFKKQNESFFNDYQLGVLNIHAYTDFATSIWRHLPLMEQSALISKFIDEIIRPAIKSSVIDLIRSHQTKGDLVAVITATNEFVTRPITDLFGIQHLLAVELEKDKNGNFTGKIQGIPSFQEGKITRVLEWILKLGYSWNFFEKTYFYSDSMNDLPLLTYVSHPIATNPSVNLAKIAHQKKWKILKIFE
jgi:HAD superfamily hydrolase (TIGR01490 family)